MSKHNCFLRRRRRQPQHELLLLLLLVTVSLLLSVADATFVLSVPALDEVCFVIRTPKGPESSLVTGSFDLLDDDLPPDPIVVSIHDETMHRFYTSKPRVKSGTFNVVVTGRIYLCAHSGVDHDSHHALDYNIRLVGVHVQVRTLDKTSAVMECVQRMQSNLANIRSQHDYLRTREALHRELVEQTFTKLLVWSLIEAGCVLLASAAQIMYMRRFIEKRRAY